VRGFVVVLLVGCGTARSSITTLTIRDPSRVALLKDGEAVLPAGGPAATVDLGSQTVEPEPGGRSELALAARRAEQGEISVRWETHLPLVNGEEQSLVPATGLVVAEAPALQPPAPPMLRLDACAYLAPNYVARPTNNGRTHVEEQAGLRAVAGAKPCPSEQLGATPLALETPWDNVVIQRRTKATSQTREGFYTIGGLLVATPLLVVLSAGGGGNFKSNTEAIEVGAALGGTALIGILLVVAGRVFFPAETVTTQTLGPDGTVIEQSPAVR
jgi:hypothetical protein